MEFSTKGFETLCMEEASEINGGGPVIVAILAGAAAVTAVATAAKACYDLGTYVGKAIAHATR